MTVRNCRKCGKLFNYIQGVPICPSCKEEVEKTFQEVKTYVREHKNAGIQEVAEACNVETSQIKQWIREERLEFTSDSSVMLPCEKCGTMIRSGKYCDRCKQNMADSLSSAIPKPKAPAQPEKMKSPEHQGMRFMK